MTLQELLGRLEGVKGGGGSYTAKCPAHPDTKPSLSISQGENGKLLLHCHAGCTPEAIMDAMGLTMKDLFEIRPETVFPSYGPGGKKEKPPVVATYRFYGEKGELVAQKLRRADKSFAWRRPDGKGGWIYNRQGVPHRLYVAGKLEGSVFICEGEKDADNLHALGYDAASGADGAGPGKWRKEYTAQLRGLHVCVFQDNDQVGKDYAAETCAALASVAASVRLLDLSKVWPEIPEHGDVSDFITAVGHEKAGEGIAHLVANAPEWAVKNDDLLSCFKTLDNFQEEEAKWLIPGWMPEAQVTLMAADGGVGKTTIWCNIIAALSNGTSCILDPPGHTRPPMKVAFLTTEDSIRKKLRKKLRQAGANMNNIIAPDFTGNSELLHKLKFGSPEMEKALRHFRPVFCTFDPVQGFIPPRINMGSRNEMRDCMAPLISIGEEVGTTSLVICHTNKRKGASGRDRIADSADLWDIARSVIMAGYTEEQGVRYLSNEKNNYAQLQETILFTIDGNGQPHRAGTTWKRDKEYTQEADLSRSAPKKEDCKAFILKTIDDAGGSLPTKELEDAVHSAGYAFKTIRNAKDELKREGQVKYFSVGGNKEKVWYIQRMLCGDLTEITEDDPDAPWNDEGASDRGKRTSTDIS